MHILENKGRCRTVSLFAVTLSICVLFTYVVQAQLDLDVVNRLEESPRQSTLNGKVFSDTTEKLGGASGTRSAYIDQVKFFYKNVNHENRYKIFDSVIASRLLNLHFNGAEKRFPPIYVGVSRTDPETYAISEELMSFKSVYALYNEGHRPFYNIKQDANGGWMNESLKDLANLYVGLFLIGGGDVHPQNVMYSILRNFFGDVDFDVAFKLHIAFLDGFKDQKKLTTSDLALREYSCNDPCPNFLYLTDSRFSHKEYTGYKTAYNYEHYKDKELLHPNELLEAMENITSRPLSDYEDSINETIQAIQSGYKSVVGVELAHDFLSGEKLSLLTARYELMKFLAKKYRKHAKRSSVEASASQITKWCKAFQKVKEPAKRDEL